MKMLSWNIRGLGDPVKRASARSFFSLYRADIVLIQETKLNSFSSRLTSDLTGGFLDEWAALYATGSAGGMCIGWNSAYFDLLDTLRGKFFLTVKLKNLRDNFVFFVSSVYGTPYYFNKDDFGMSLEV